MFNTPEIIVAKISKFVSDEVHIVGKQSAFPSAVLSFVPIDENGNRVLNYNPILIQLKGASYNEFYQKWNDEKSLYESLLSIAENKTEGFQISEIDINLFLQFITSDTQEVLAIKE